jgi:hypothetical protein
LPNVFGSRNNNINFVKLKLGGVKVEATAVTPRRCAPTSPS